EEKARSMDTKVNLFCQDMSEFNSPELMDSILCFCDSLNYLTVPHEVSQTFAQVYQALKPGGVFIFDVHSLYKIKEVFENQSFNWVEENLVYVWDCQAEEHNQVSHYLTFFAKEGQLYRRFDESHFQRGYSQDQLQCWLRETGFS